VNLTESARLLTMISSFNNRTVGEGDVIAWQSVLTDVILADAEEAVRRHYAENTEWLMPAHVRRLVRDIHRERASAATPWAPGQHGVPKEQAYPELPHGVGIQLDELSPRVANLLLKLRAELPKVPREKLFPRETYWDRQQRGYERLQASQPNPLYRAAASATTAHTPIPSEVIAEAADKERVKLIEDCRILAAHDSGSHTPECPDFPHGEVSECPGTPHRGHAHASEPCPLNG
jgi:hypothetical protein